MSKRNNRIVVFTSSGNNSSEEDLKEVLLKVLQIHFDKEIRKKE
ncbi:hypothetical protein [Wukongibacter sp. M2B1]